MPSQGQSKTKQPRMRDSCEACAKSKLKCSRDKPICKRCQERWLSCYYCPSQRAGRISSSAAAAAGKIPKRPTSPQTPKSAKSLSPDRQGRLPEKTNSLQSPCYGPFDFFDASIPNKDFNTDIMYMNLQDDIGFDTAMADPLNFRANVLENFESEYSSPDRSSTIQSILSNLEDPASMVESFTTTSFQIQSPPVSISKEVLDRHPSLDEKVPESVRPHGCCAAAMSLLTLQSTAGPTTCVQSKPSGRQPILPTINSVVAQNRVTIDSINTMLTCPCSLDRHLSTIIFLIAFKVIAWYAAVARVPDWERVGKTIDLTHEDFDTITQTERVLQAPTTVGGYQIDGANSARMRAQLVLGELHRVQRLVELLSKRLEGMRQRSDDAASVSSIVTCREPISSSIFVQLEADLRRRLLAVSKETMEILRDG